MGTRFKVNTKARNCVLWEWQHIGIMNFRASVSIFLFTSWFESRNW